MNDAQSGLRRREIREEDLAGVVDLLVRGFPARARRYWERGLRRMADRPAVEGCPRYGFVLDDGGLLVGTVLMLFTRDGAGRIRCNFSSWTVDAAYRAQAPLLVASALTRPEVTFTNISPARHTWPLIEVQGFRPYADGQSLVLPLLGPIGRTARVSADPASWCDLPEAALLDDHRGYGCVCVAVEDGGEPHPIVLLPARARTGRYPLPLLQVVFCRDIGDVTRFAGALGRWMIRRGFVGLLVDGGVPEGLVGRARVRRGRKYARGPHPPRIGDLSYTELVIFGP